LLLMNSQYLGPLKTYALNKPMKDFVLDREEFSAIVTLKNGKKRREEFPLGNTHMSQNSQRMWLNSSIQQAEMYNQKLKRTRSVSNL